jgi:chaperonin GroES
MIKPAGYRVTVKPDPLEEVTESGLIVAWENKDREQAGAFYGTLAAVGPSAWKAYDDGTPWASVGDRVVFSRYAGRYIDDPDDIDTKYILLNDEDVLAVITKEGKE